MSFDLRIFVVACLTTIVAGIAAGLAPALQLLKTSLTGAFQDGSKGATEGTRRKRFRSLLVAGEMTLALVLLVGAGLMVPEQLQTDVELSRILPTSPPLPPEPKYSFVRQLRKSLAPPETAYVPSDAPCPP